MSALRDLVVGDRVAHREDHSWKDAQGVVIKVDPLIYVRWESDGDLGPYDRGDLVVADDPDIEATDENPLKMDGTPVNGLCRCGQPADAAEHHGSPNAPEEAHRFEAVTP